MNIFPKTFPVTSHTDFVGQGSTFVAIKGMKNDGTHFIPLALERGATTIVIEQTVNLGSDIERLIQEKNARLVRVEECRKALAELSAQVLNYPAQKLKIVGITGTKGKTTTSFLINHILSSCGYKTALLSSVHNTIGSFVLPTNLTTQHPDYLHVFFDQCVKNNIDYVVMEVAAQAHSLQRVHGISYDAFLFTNFDREHAEFYATLQDYFNAKVALLKQVKLEGSVILNSDNLWCKKLLNEKKNFLSIGQERSADYQFQTTKSSAQTTDLALSFFGNPLALSTKLIGYFNAYNCVGAFAICHQLGLNADSIVHALQKFDYVPGRLERYHLPNNAVCFIDYAHNPSSYESVLSTLRTLTDNLIVVCGAGGDRDKGKRPLMGALATQYADHVIFTTDNPRSEDPKAIIEDMVAGVGHENQHKLNIVFDREEAINKAYEYSKEGSIIVLLGKGPDHYQIVNDIKIYFNEAEIIQKLV